MCLLFLIKHLYPDIAQIVVEYKRPYIHDDLTPRTFKFKALDFVADPITPHVYVACGNSIKKKNMDTGKTELKFIGHVRQVVKLAIYENKIASYSPEGNIRIWDNNTGKCLQSFKIQPSSSIVNMVYHTYHFITIQDKYEIYTLSLVDNKFTYVLDNIKYNNMEISSKNNHDILINGDLVLKLNSSENTTKLGLYNPFTKSIHSTLTIPYKHYYIKAAKIPNNRIILWYADADLIIWDTKENKYEVVNTGSALYYSVCDVAYYNKNTVLLTDKGDSIAVWNLKTKETWATFLDPECTYDPDNQAKELNVCKCIETFCVCIFRHQKVFVAGSVKKVGYLDDGRIIALNTSGTVTLWG